MPSQVRDSVMLACLGGRVGFLFYVGVFRRQDVFFVLCWRV